MVCDVVQFNRIEAAEGNSGSRPDCVATSAAFFLGEFPMKCGHETCPLLEISLIPLTQGKYAIVDIEDYKWLMRWKWCAQKDRYTYYAVRNETRAKRNDEHKTIQMHRAILNISQGMQADHRNHNGLDNRRRNIRTCTHAQNQHNQRPQKNCESKYKGVRRHRAKWQAEIQNHNKYIYLGTYESEIEAAKVYDAKAIELFGEFAYTNF